MKDKIKYSNGTIIANDDKKEIQIYNYQDNIKEIIMSENDIEKLENKIFTKTNELNQQQALLKLDKTGLLGGFWSKLFLTLGITAFFSIIFMFVAQTMFDFCLGILGMSGMASLIVFGIDASVQKTVKERTNVVNGYTIEIAKLKEMLEQKRIELENLLSDNKREKESEFVRKYGDRDINISKYSLEKIDYLSELYYETGYDLEKLYELYLNRQLYSAITNKTFYEEIEDIIEEYGPKLAKRK